MKPKHVYLILCVLGFALPYALLVPWIMQNGLNMKYFVQQLFATRIGGFFGLDVLVSVNRVVPASYAMRASAFGCPCCGLP
jgi:uncharacterized protein DUF2834